MRHFLTAAAVGLVLSLAAHITTYCTARLTRTPGVVTALFLGLFPVFTAAAVAASRLPGKGTKGAAGRRARDEGDFPEGTPRWLRRWVMALLAYLFALWLSPLAFYLFGLWRSPSAFPAGQGGGVPTRQTDGRLVLRDRGRIVRSLTPEEFEARENLSLRWQSGGCMFFYSFSLIPLLAWRRSQKSPGGVVGDPELA